MCIGDVTRAHGYMGVLICFLLLWRYFWNTGMCIGVGIVLGVKMPNKKRCFEQKIAEK